MDLYHGYFCRCPPLLATIAMDLYHGYFCWCPPLLATSLLWTCIMAIFVGVHPSWPPLLWTCIMAIFVGVHPSWPPACYGPVSWLFLLVSTPPGHQLAMDLYHGYFCWCPPLLLTSLLWTCIMAIFVGVHPSWPPACYGPVSWLFL